jgi:Putative phage metallopeptidase
MHLVVFLFTLLVPACQKDPPPRLIPTHELAWYLANFVHDSNGIIRIEDIADSHYVFKKLKWSSKKGGVIAQCISTLHRAPFTIEVEPRYWRKASDATRMAILYHELGHCACNRTHTFEKYEEWLDTTLRLKFDLRLFKRHTLDDGCPDAIMNWEVPQGDCFEEHREEYVKDLFARCTPPRRFE